MQFPIDEILPGSDAKYIVIKPPEEGGFMEYVAAAMEVVSVMDKWPDYTPVIHWPDGEGRNLFYRYFKLGIAGFRFCSEEELLKNWKQHLRPTPLTREELLAGGGGTDHHYYYIADYSPGPKSLVDESVPLSLRLVLMRASKGYYKDKFKGKMTVVGVDTAHLDVSGLERVCTSFERILRQNLDVRMFCSTGDDHTINFLVDRYQKRVYVRKKNDPPILRDSIMESAILSNCSYLLGTHRSPMFTIARALCRKK